MTMPRRFGTAVFAIGVALLGSAIARAQSTNAITTDELVGRWGVAAYWNDTDAASVTQQARGFCRQPYVITRGRNGGAMMFEAFHGRPQEVRISGGQIVALDGTAQTTKTISRWDGTVLVFSYDEAEARRRYGNMVFVRCGR